jgi:hypothetical protein
VYVTLCVSVRLLEDINSCQFKLSSMRITAMAPGRQVAVASTAGFLGISAVLGWFSQPQLWIMLRTWW